MLILLLGVFHYFLNDIISFSDNHEIVTVKKIVWNGYCRRELDKMQRIGALESNRPGLKFFSPLSTCALLSPPLLLLSAPPPLQPETIPYLVAQYLVVITIFIIIIVVKICREWCQSKLQNTEQTRHLLVDIRSPVLFVIV